MSDTHVFPDQRVSDQHPADSSAATRHLCAGVYLHRGFRDLVIRKVHNDPYHRVAPSYGFDLIPVVRHAWWARSLEVVLHTAVVGSVLVPWFLGQHLAAALVAGGLVLCLLTWNEVRRARRLAREQAKLAAEEKQRRPRRGRQAGRRQRSWADRRSESPLLRELPQRLQFGIAALVAVALATRLLWSELPDDVRLAGAILLGTAGVAAVVGGIRQYRLNGVHDTVSRPTRLSRREQVIHSQQSHACAVYRRTGDREDEDELSALGLFGRESPFVGTGELIHHWNPPMTVQMLRPGIPGTEDEDLRLREYTDPPFKAHELVAHLKSAVQQLDRDVDAVRLRPKVRDRIYVSESDVSIDRDLLRMEPSESEIAEIINSPEGTKHHYLEVSVPAAGAELVTIVLLRVSVKGRALSLDFAACALTRTPQEFQRIDAYAEHGKRAVLSAALRAPFKLPAEFPQLWRLAEFPVMLTCAAWARKDRTLTPRRGVMIGTRVSVREEKAEEWGEVQLDKTTILDRMKIIEERLLTATRDFLKSRKVDTSAFENRALQIINSGIVNMGGNNEVSNTAVGDNAQTINNPAGQQGPNGNQQQRGGNR